MVYTGIRIVKGYAIDGDKVKEHFRSCGRYLTEEQIGDAMIDADEVRDVLLNEKVISENDDVFNYQCCSTLNSEIFIIGKQIGKLEALKHTVDYPSHVTYVTPFFALVKPDEKVNLENGVGFDSNSTTLKKKTVFEIDPDYLLNNVVKTTMSVLEERELCGDDPEEVYLILDDCVYCT